MAAAVPATAVGGRTVTAGNARSVHDAGRYWYGGISGGVPFFMSTFSSFGGSVRPGYSVGVFGGRQLTPVLSAELYMQFSLATLSARDCCAASGYLLGSDGRTYLSPVAGMECHGYGSLQSSVRMQQYGMQLNIDILSLINTAVRGRWMLSLSPRIGAAFTDATIKCSADGRNIIHTGSRCHLGIGCGIQAGWRLTDRMTAGIYTGITCLTGSPIDGITESVHRNNFVWENGIRLAWRLGKGGGQ